MVASEQPLSGHEILNLDAIRSDRLVMLGKQGHSLNGELHVFAWWMFCFDQATCRLLG